MIIPRHCIIKGWTNNLITDICPEPFML